MADKILHKRSLTQGSVPTTSSLEIGELAINVNDGKLFLHQSGSIANKIVNVGESASFAATASFVETAQTASYVLNAVSSSYALTASYAMNGGGGSVDTGSLVTTASFNAYTGSVASQFAGTASYALTASFALNGGGGGGAVYTRRSDYTSSLDPNINYLYLGEAVSGSSEASNVWDISRLSISSSGATLTQTTSSAAWTNRYSYTYS
jgi:hypothetical protein